MITTRGIIRPNGHKTHHHGAISFYEEAPREFHVDDKADRVADVPPLGADKKGETLAEYAARLKPLVLTPAAYAELKAKFGAALVCEPIDAAPGELEALRARVAVLEEQLAAAKAKPAK